MAKAKAIAVAQQADLRVRGLMLLSAAALLCGLLLLISP